MDGRGDAWMGMEMRGRGWKYTDGQRRADEHGNFKSGCIAVNMKASTSPKI